jgi:diaminopimelate decarboxylase
MTPNALAIFPDTAHISPAGSLVVGGCDSRRLAEEFGTPLYLYDATTLDGAVDTYRRGLAQSYPAATQLAYAAKAWLCTATARWAARRALALDVVSGGELAIAQRGGVEPGQIHFHGNNKSDAELAQALDAGVGRVVIDHQEELRRLNALALSRSTRQRIWLRVNPMSRLAPTAISRPGTRPPSSACRCTLARRKPPPATRWLAKESS